MFIILLWLIGTGLATFYFWSLWIAIFSEAYDSGNFVKFIVSVFFFLMIPGSSGFLWWIFLVLIEKLEQKEKSKFEKIEEEKRIQEEKELKTFHKNLEKEKKKWEEAYNKYLENSKKLKEDAENCKDPLTGWEYFINLYNTYWVEYADLVAKFLDYRDAQEIFDIWEQEEKAEINQ